MTWLLSIFLSVLYSHYGSLSWELQNHQNFFVLMASFEALSIFGDLWKFDAPEQGKTSALFAAISYIKRTIFNRNKYWNLDLQISKNLTETRIFIITTSLEYIFFNNKYTPTRVLYRNEHMTTSDYHVRAHQNKRLKLKYPERTYFYPMGTHVSPATVHREPFWDDPKRNTYWIVFFLIIYIFKWI